MASPIYEQPSDDDLEESFRQEQQRWDRLAQERDTLRSEVARLTAEVEARKSGSDIWHRAAIEAQDERDALRAEVEAMREVVEVATEVVETDTGLRDLRLALDALRARKVGG